MKVLSFLVYGIGCASLLLGLFAPDVAAKTQSYAFGAAMFAAGACLAAWR